MATFDVKAIQIGGTPLNLDDWIDYRYLSFEDCQTAVIKDQPVFKNGRVTPKFYDCRYLIPADSPVVRNLEWLRHLPANGIVLADSVAIPAAQQRLTEQLNVQRVSFADRQQLAQTLKLNFFTGQYGFQFQTEHLQVAPSYLGVVKKRGIEKTIFAGPFTDQMQWLGSFNFPYFAKAATQWEILAEVGVTGNVDLELRMTLLATNSQYEDQQMCFSLKQLLSGAIVLPPFMKTGYNVTFSLYGCGKGTVEVGTIFFRQSHNGRGAMMIGGQAVIDPNDMNRSWLMYFDAGDLRPPLNVYFSGNRADDGFEGNFMMRRLGAPYILVSDQRFTGGGFYVGNQKFAHALVQYIQDKLALLGFTSDQLIMSGVSMGTYGSEYYAADLKPHAIIAGKQLAGLGRIATNNRIKRPDDFDNGLDILSGVTGGLTDEDVDKGDHILVDHMATGDLSHTKFAITYMKNDDYDDEGFKTISQFLWKNYPGLNFRHKGLIGRHIDQPGAMFQWFLDQYKDIMVHDFGRTEMAADELNYIPGEEND
ncbi:hypothetical protein IV38_GL001905 [Lactobacillus selangorensis]|uniref:Accessory secretory protein Asp2 n=1 Tax=Lactobacillus selangorensis TaxID=81857 RepID=A0A0R2FRK5_9LACO|nr:accessory Sec system protein Asp2 [Lactobacillus selangorensis]KRN27692.1 hypothetical protein IV38_GL001905 [Lactobacillus selangorensis]KRN30343.1 hypothetical protein IV40_GL001932 [Lactobacillus selangorensis]